MAQLFFNAVYQTINHGCGAKHHAASHTVNSIFSDNGFRAVQADTGKLCSAAGQCIQRNFDTGEDYSTEIFVFRFYNFNGGRGAEIHKD